MTAPRSEHTPRTPGSRCAECAADPSQPERHEILRQVWYCDDRSATAHEDGRIELFTVAQTKARRRLGDAAPELLAALEGILWKLSHNFSAKGDGSDGVPSTIDRRDATVAQARSAIARATDGAS